MTHENPYATPTAAVADEHALGSATYCKLDLLSARGRIGRLRHFVYSLVVMLASGLLTVGVEAFATPGSSDPLVIGSIVLTVPIYIIQIFFSVRRLHDINVTGWLWLLFLVPVANLILGLVLLFVPGTPGPNRYGAPPPPNSSSVIALAIGVPGALFALAYVLNRLTML